MKTVLYSHENIIQNEVGDTAVVIYTVGNYITGHDMIKLVDTLNEEKYQTLVNQHASRPDLIIFHKNSTVVKSLSFMRRLISEAIRASTKKQVDEYLSTHITINSAFVIDENMWQLIKSVCTDDMYQEYKNKPMLKEETFAEKLAALESKWAD